MGPMSDFIGGRGASIRHGGQKNKKKADRVISTEKAMEEEKNTFCLIQIRGGKPLKSTYVRGGKHLVRAREESWARGLGKGEKRKTQKEEDPHTNSAAEETKWENDSSLRVITNPLGKRKRTCSLRSYPNPCILKKESNWLRKTI